jgi:GWxTD domain-containing protein
MATKDIRGLEPLVNNGLGPASRLEAVTETPSSPEIAPQYQAWLDQDVRWLISPQERAAFLQLTSDAERDHFIEQFWKRRNSPGSAADSYRAEHYRRNRLRQPELHGRWGRWLGDRPRPHVHRQRRAQHG